MKRRRVLPALVVALVGLWLAWAGQGAEDLAELCVTKIVLDPPSTIARGETVEVYARIMNTGARSADGFNISFFYRHQNSSGNWTLHRTIQGVTLPPSHQDFYEVKFLLATMDMDLGTYDLRIVADSANHISETDELNNELLTTMTLEDSSLGLPDLQPVSLSYVHTNPGAVDDMEPWNVATQIRNLGETQAGQFVVAFLVDGAEFARQIRFVLPPGGVTDIVAELDPEQLGLQPGTHRIDAVIDPDNEVVEQNEGNNAITGSITLQSVELVPLSLVFEKALLRLDEEMTVTAEVRNDGEGVAKNVEVAFYAGHVRFGSDTLEILGRGMTGVAEATLDPEKVGLVDAPADYRIQVVVDPNDQLHEFDEANNTMSRTLTIHPAELKRPEIHPESIELTPPSPVEQLRVNTLTVSSVIKNTGRAAAEAFDVTFAYRIKGGRRWESLECSDDAGCSSVTLAAGEQTKLVGQLPVSESLLGPGIYEIRILVDANGRVDELDETNNELVTTLTLLSSRLADLAFCAEGVTLQPVPSVRQGQTVRLSACIGNLGEQDAGPFEVRLSYCPVSSVGTSQGVQCSDPYQQGNFSPGPRLSVPSLSMAESVVISAMLETADLRPGQYNLRVEIDPAGAVQERNVLNNTLAGIPLTVLGPDLAVVELAPSPAGVVDQAVTDRLDVAATILNTGVVPTGEFTVRFRLMRMGEQGPVPVQVHFCGETTPSVCESPEFACTQVLPGIGVLVPVQVRWALDLAESNLVAGQYILRVEADCEGDVNSDGLCDGRIDEHNELNNALEIPLTVLPRPADLVVAGPIEFPDGTPVNYGAVVPIKASIANIGGSAAGGTCGTRPSCGIGVEFLVYEGGAGAPDGERLVRLTPLEQVATLEPGEAVEITALLDTSVLDPAVTGYRICVRVDPNGSIAELDESNNELCTPPQLELYPPPPDLRLAARGGAGQPVVMFDPAPPVAYDEQPIRALFTIVNDSRSAAGGFNVGFRLRRANDEDAVWMPLPAKVAVDRLGPGESRPVSYEILFPHGEDAATADGRGFVPLGAYEFCIELDVDGFVDEVDEENNTYCVPIGVVVVDEGFPPPAPCRECPDLKIRSASAQVIAGIARVCATIENIGTADAGAFTVRAYYVPAHGAEPVEIVDPKHRTRYERLAAGDTDTFRQELDASIFAEGFYDVFIVVDVLNEVAEAIETNNKKDESLWVH